MDFCCSAVVQCVLARSAFTAVWSAQCHVIAAIRACALKFNFVSVPYAQPYVLSSAVSQSAVCQVLCILHNISKMLVSCVLLYFLMPDL